MSLKVTFPSLFLFQVFKEDSSSADFKSEQVAESILRFFSGFDAFTLPSPTVDVGTMKSINQRKDEINPKFWSGLEKFKSLIRTTLSPKHSFNDGEFVTGEGKIELSLICNLFIPVKFMSFSFLVLFFYFDLADFTCVHSLCPINLVNMQFINVSHSTYITISIHHIVAIVVVV